MNQFKHKRLESLDALRGFDMLWITGGGALAIAISKLTGWEWLETQMDHVPWAGFHFYDLIFPLFMFISGVAIPYALQGKLDRGESKGLMVKKAFKRLAILFFFGLLYNGTFKVGFGSGRVASVLGQIGIAYFLAAVIYIFFPSLKNRLIWLLIILIGVGIIQLLIPVPGFGPGVLTKEGCINGYIDRMFLPGRLYGGVFDPEGILCSISATGVTLMGTFAGSTLRNHETTDWKKIRTLTITGVISIAVALLISNFYPIIKSCWTSTFNLLTGGIGFLLMALFYMIIDHWGYHKWAFYFKVIGMNSIFVYLFARFIDVKKLSEYVFGWIAMHLGNYGDLLLIIGKLLIIWLILYYMYKKKIFLRV